MGSAGTRYCLVSPLGGFRGEDGYLTVPGRDFPLTDLSPDEPLGGLLPERYRDPVPIGTGAMATIYRARDERLGRDVAVKVPSPAAVADETNRRRFIREATAAARVRHPNVATIYDVGEHDGRLYLVMELVEGGNLEDRLARGRPPRVEALRLIAQAAAALDAAHAAGVVHRDVKPSNLLLDEAGTVKVADFGIARVLGDSGTLTAPGTVLGSFGYASPEQALGEPTSPASDVYSLAAVAFELLTGDRPYGGRRVSRNSPPTRTRPSRTPASGRRPLCACGRRAGPRAREGPLRAVPQRACVCGGARARLHERPPDRRPARARTGDGARAPEVAGRPRRDCGLCRPADRGGGGRRRDRGGRRWRQRGRCRRSGGRDDDDDAGGGRAAAPDGRGDRHARGPRGARARARIAARVRAQPPATGAPTYGDAVALTDQATAAQEDGDPAQALALADRRSSRSAAPETTTRGTPVTTGAARSSTWAAAARPSPPSSARSLSAVRAGRWASAARRWTRPTPAQRTEGGVPGVPAERPRRDPRQRPLRSRLVGAHPGVPVTAALALADVPRHPHVGHSGRGCRQRLTREATSPGG